MKGQRQHREPCNCELEQEKSLGTSRGRQTKRGGAIEGSSLVSLVRALTQNLIGKHVCHLALENQRVVWTLSGSLCSEMLYC